MKNQNKIPLVRLAYLFFLLSAVMLSFPDNVRGQYDNVWALGVNAGIDFNTNPPQAITTSLNTAEGSATICDANGRLLFYTDGSFVRDRNNNFMPNGIDLTGTGGNLTASTSQGALIVPIPGDVQKYYIFSLGSRESLYPGKLYYSIVDMTLNSGLGDVIATNKGILMDSLLTEHMTAVSGNDCNIWLIVISNRDTSFKVYDINANGIVFSPVLSPRTPGWTDYFFEGLVGTIDVAPDRNKLIVAQDNLVLYNFNIVTGRITSPVILDDAQSYYGVSFSPDNSRLYTTTANSLQQFDLSSGDAATMTASKTLIASSGTMAIKRGPDGKMYSAVNHASFLHVINQPNALGTACQYVDQGFPLLAGTNSRVGLPNAITRAVINKNTRSKADTISCADSSLLMANNPSGIGYVWDDGSTGSSRYIDSSGTYWVRYQAAGVQCEEYIDTFHIVFHKIRRIFTTSHYDGFCKADTVLLEATTLAAFRYIWDDNSQNIKRKVTQGGTYWVSYQIDSLCELYADTFHVTYPAKDYEVSFISDTLVCIDDLIQFQNTSDFHFNQFAWSFGNQDSSNLQNPIHSYNQEGIYKVMLIGKIGNICADTTVANILVDAPFTGQGFLKNKDNICVGQAIVFIPQTDSIRILNLHWSFGDGNDVSVFNEAIQHAYDISGIMAIQLIATFRACSDRSFLDTVNVYPLPVVNLGSDTVLCLNGSPIGLSNHENNQPGYSYRWNTEENSEYIQVKHYGKYSLTITSGQRCMATDEIEIAKSCYLDIPNGFTPNGDGLNDYFFPRQSLSTDIKYFRLQLLNRWGQIVFETLTLNGRGWDGKWNNKEQPAGVYIYMIETMFGNNIIEKYQGNVTLIR